MDLKEFKRLSKLDTLKRLPKTDIVANQSENNLLNKNLLLKYIVKITSKPANDFDNSMISILKNYLEQNFGLTGNGVFLNPYHIESRNVNGKFFNAIDIFKDEKYPSFVQKNYCHSNSYEFAKRHDKPCKVLAGIAYKNKLSFLHSVVEVDGCILDFNYDLVMSKGLYFQLFNFKVLNEIRNEDIKVNASKLVDCYAGKINYGELNYCFYELVNMMENNQELSI